MKGATVRTATLLAAAALLAPAVAPAADEKGDLAALQGTWEATSAWRNGKEAPPEQVAKHILRIKGDRCEYEMFRTILRGKLKLNPAKSPKEANFVHADKSERNMIYELKGNTLRLCFPTRSPDRPTGFHAKDGFQLTVFKKAK
jgi:uncharacterized protein (TIGR03067 family)